MLARRLPTPVATFLADAGALAGVWGFCGFFFGGVAGAWAGLEGEDMGSWVTTGAGGVRDRDPGDRRVGHLAPLGSRRGSPAQSG